MKAFVTLPKNSTFPTFFTLENISLAESLYDVVWNESTARLSGEEVAAHIGNSDIYVTAWSSPRLDRTILDKAPDLKLLVHLCGTVVPFVSDEMWERGIRVISGNDFFAESVAEGTIAYMLTALREIPRYSADAKAGLWRDSNFCNRGLLGRTVGIVSYGTIARHLVRMLAPFRVKIKVYDIKPLPEEDVARYGLTQVSLEEIFADSDIVTVHTPLYDKTHHLIGEELLRLLPKDALFLNTSRGAVVDEAALVRQLATGRFSAVLDVYEKEPLSKENPLTGLENVLLMPHMGGPTTDLRPQITRALLQESAAFLKHGGALPHEITRSVAATMSRS